ncbi:MAG: hydrogenase maturation nickel metallochaperone HypA/HybF [bacterium JZ-2024 1]
MHELSLVRAVLEMLANSASDQGIRRIVSVHLKVNPLVGFDPEDVTFSFDLAKKDFDVLQDAHLNLEVMKGEVICGACGNKFVVDELPGLCEHCGSLELTPVERAPLIVVCYECDR